MRVHWRVRRSEAVAALCAAGFFACFVAGDSIPAVAFGVMATVALIVAGVGTP